MQEVNKRIIEGKLKDYSNPDPRHSADDIQQRLDNFIGGS